MPGCSGAPRRAQKELEGSRGARREGFSTPRGAMSPRIRELLLESESSGPVGTGRIRASLSEFEDGSETRASASAFHDQSDGRIETDRAKSEIESDRDHPSTARGSL